MIRYDNDLFYFQYAPPTERPEDASSGKRPTRPFSGAQPWQCSVYYFWWLFLRENTAYLQTCAAHGDGPCTELYDDFGDVRSDDFVEWWMERGRDLFCEPRGSGVQGVEQDDLRRMQTRSDRLLLSVDRNCDIERTISEVRSLLQMRHIEGLTARHTSRALYPVFTKPVLTSLHQHHLVWMTRKAHPDLPLYRVGELAGIMPSIKADDAESRAKLTSVTGRALRQAEKIIEYVGNGVFPVTTDEQVATIPRFLERVEQSSLARVAEILDGPYALSIGQRRRFNH